MSIIEQLSVQIEMGMAVVSPPHAAVVVQVVVEFKQLSLSFLPSSLSEDPFRDAAPFLVIPSE
jgi:hypothetical protein